ncbi:MAG TPA: condensation domain-containing protein, partial [Anaerolineae bacterium]|nr:condensation domain-containing protein [Anaerolineae bacterium]
MPKEVIEGFRLSPQQKHLWLVQQTDQSHLYRAQCALQLEGQLKPEFLTTALAHVVNRHEILRTTFQRLTGMAIPLQVISADSAFSL